MCDGHVIIYGKDSFALTSTVRRILRLREKKEENVSDGVVDLLPLFKRFSSSGIVFVVGVDVFKLFSQRV